MNNGIIPVITQSSTTFVPFQDVLYILRDKRVSIIYAKSGVYRIADKMDSIFESLDSRFFRSHYSCIVNFQNLKVISAGRLCFVNGEEMYLGKKAYYDTRRGYIKYLKEAIAKQRNQNKKK